MTSSCCKLAWTMVLVTIAVAGGLAAVFIPAAAHEKLVSGVKAYMRIDSPSQREPRACCSGTRCPEDHETRLVEAAPLAFRSPRGTGVPTRPPPA